MKVVNFLIQHISRREPIEVYKTNHAAFMIINYESLERNAHV